MLFPSLNGLIIVEPTRKQIQNKQHSVIIQEIVANGRSVLSRHLKPKQSAKTVKAHRHRPAQEDTTLSNKNELPETGKTLQISPGNGDFLEIRYGANLFHHASPVRYQHRLIGSKDTWTDAGANRYVSYSNLGPGTYRIELQSTHTDQTHYVDSIEIQIMPHYYQTRFFQGGVLVTLLAVVISLHRGRLRQRLKVQKLENELSLQKERSRIAQDMHDDFGANLTRISFIAEAAKEAGEDLNQVRQHLETIGTTTRNAIVNISELIWATNPSNDTLPSLVAYLRKVAASQLEYSNLKTELIFPTRAPNIILLAAYRRDLLMILKEALNNVMKHARASHVRVRLAVGEEAVDLAIIDDGVGFVPGFEKSVDQTTGNGLKHMTRRAESHNGMFNINSRPQEGTQIEVSIPLPKSNLNA